MCGFGTRSKGPSHPVVCYKPWCSEAFRIRRRDSMSTANRTLVCLGLLVTIGAIVLVEGKEIRSSGVAVQAASMAKAKGVMDASGVMYFSSEEITPAFKANLMMYDGGPEKNYRVAVFHPDKGGEVEVHKKDTDVFYIMEGEGTFVTGATATDGRETAQHDVQIATMEGGV